MRIGYNELKDFTWGVLGAVGLDDFSRGAVTTGLCETSLRGVDSHGIRLLPHYAAAAISGRKNPTPRFAFTRTFPAMGRLEADNGFGQAAGMKAIECGLEMAAETGLGAVGVVNSSHPGAMASMALKAAREGYMALALTHADSLLLSHGGVRPFFGTNPICFAAPRVDAEPYCLDMATSKMPWNRLLIHKDNGDPLPNGVAADSTGSETTNADAAACLTPLGSPMAGYKGTGMASMVEVFCAVFTGMAFGRNIPAMYKAPMDQPRGLGQFYLVMRTDGCVSMEQFRQAMQDMTRQIRDEPSRPGEQVMMAGDKEIRAAERRLRDGIPLDDDIAAGLSDLSRQYDIPVSFQ